MEIQRYDKMQVPAQKEYIAELVLLAEKSLNDASRPDDAAKVSELFAKSDLGGEQFLMTLGIARVADAKSHVKEPNAPRVKVEKVMAVSLEKNNSIKLPPDFLTMASNLDQQYAAAEKKK